MFHLNAAFQLGKKSAPSLKRIIRTMTELTGSSESNSVDLVEAKSPSNTGTINGGGDEKVNFAAKILPSTHTANAWLAAEQSAFRYREADGKWMMFFSRDVIDARWEEARQLYLSGDFLRISSILVSTAMPSPDKPANLVADHVILFFCGPAEEEASVKEVGRCLVERFPPDDAVIFYKANKPTDLAAVEKSGIKPGRKWKYRLNCVPRKQFSTSGSSSSAESEQEMNGTPAKSKLVDEKPVSLPRTLSKSKASLNDGDLVMVLDTETTGFPPGAPPENILAWTYCRMLELAFHIYRSDGTIHSKEAYLIKPDFDFPIPEGALRVHGITKERATADGLDLTTVLEIFHQQLAGVSVVVGHNIQFDVKILLAEICRSGIPGLRQKFEAIPTECTMQMGARVMPNGRRPKLAVLYEECFGGPPDGVMHRADADVEACAKIYFLLREVRAGQPRRSLSASSSADSCSSKESSAESSLSDSHSSEHEEDGVEHGSVHCLHAQRHRSTENFFQENAVLLTLTLAVASTAIFIMGFSN
ncbi:hypothetical protein BV898_12917 [Hypsibius exemplaris]|uniref:Exonuclease domain-containing protein n=1 Tax=Hypsibius exemplaris TaxID=2072580 RepID=A0A1W0WC80_HYPEX|nr:hypothetical protein BV898_12917 [Hypsibius exemplaris]